MVKLETAQVISQVQIAAEEFMLTLYCPEIVQEAQAGQFVTVQVSEQIQPLLRRPISIHGVDLEKGWLLLYYHVVGTGTKLLSQFTAGQDVSLLGPLGHGFDLEITESKVCLVGGGIGQAPLRYLAEQLALRGNEVIMIMGARDASGLQALDYYRAQGFTLRISTEDGSMGSQGFVTAPLEEVVADGVDRIYSCGPLPMMRAVKAIAEANQVPCQVSLEEKMACGIGVCLGCTCQSSDPKATYPKVCTHGPVFWAGEVDLNG